MVFGSPDEVEHALVAGVVQPHFEIQCAVLKSRIDDEGNESISRFETRRPRASWTYCANAKSAYESRSNVSV